MRLRLLAISLLCLALLVFPAAALAGTYYVDNSATGCGGSGCSDSNVGTSEVTAWLHLPGMHGSTVSHTPAAGDVFILEGCDDWGSANLDISWTWSGTNGNPITITGTGPGTGYPAWYNTTNCASAWNRPIIDGQSSSTQSACGNGSTGHIFGFSGAQYVTLNWIEFKGLYWNNDQQGTCFASAGYIYSSTSDNLTIENSYFHGWTHGTTAGTTDIPDSTVAIANSSPYCLHCVIEQSVIDNSDGDGATCPTNANSCSSGGVQQWSAENNVFNDVVQAWFGPTWGTTTITVSGNNISNVNLSFQVPAQGASEPHPNCMEDTGVITGTDTVLIHDNWIHSIETCEGAQIGNGPSEIDYIWNNIWDMGATGVAGVNGPQIPQNGGSQAGSTVYFWNNTIRWATGCANLYYTGSWNFFGQNNHCINDGSVVWAGHGVPTGGGTSNNVAMTNATATSQGYTSSETYAFSPTANTNSTVGAGANLTSTSPGCSTSGLSSLCSDTTYAVSEQTVNGVVEAVASGRTVNARPSSGAWDAGPYEFTSAPSGAPAPAAKMFVRVVGLDGRPIRNNDLMLASHSQIAAGAYVEKSLAMASQFPISRDGFGFGLTYRRHPDCATGNGLPIWMCINEESHSPFATVANDSLSFGHTIAAGDKEGKNRKNNGNYMQHLIRSTGMEW